MEYVPCIVPGQVMNRMSKWSLYDSTKLSSCRWPYHSSIFPEKMAKSKMLCRPKTYEVHCKRSLNLLRHNFSIKVMKNRVKLVDPSIGVVWIWIVTARRPEYLLQKCGTAKENIGKVLDTFLKIISAHRSSVLQKGFSLIRYSSRLG